MKYVWLLLALLGVGIVLYVASSQKDDARAVILNTQNPETKFGIVHLNDTPEGLHVVAKLEGVPPGKHGFHIHENGSCDDGGKAAGGHFNPGGHEHGFAPDGGIERSHAGDLGNFTADEHGRGTLEIKIQGLSTDDTGISIDEKAIILHENADDFSQPVGNAGGRIGCGIIHRK